MFLQISGFSDDDEEKTWVNMDLVGTIAWIRNSAEYFLTTTTQGALAVSELRGVDNIKTFLAGTKPVHGTVQSV